MSSYIASLNAAATVEREAAKALHVERAHGAAQAARVRLTPLDARLERLLTTIPADIQHEGLSLAALQVSLRGRWRGNCHPGELGAALRRLGFIRRRRWTDGAGFRAEWYRSSPA